MDPPKPHRPAHLPSDPFACVVAIHKCRVCPKVTETPIAQCNNGLLFHCHVPMEFKSHRQPCACPSCKPKQ